jgi:hypothetical protein
VASFVLALGLVADTSSAVADEPSKYEVTFTVSDELTDVCPFPIAITLTVRGFAIDHVDKDGVLTRTFAHSVEQDTFSANGKTLMGLPYTVNMQFIFDSDGNLIHQFGTGIYERVPLPDGSIFISAGRADFVANGVSFMLSPDKGNPGNVAAFCAALAP